METQTQIEKFKKEYNCLVKELEAFRKKHATLDKKYKVIANNLNDINDKIDTLEYEIANSANNIKEAETKYIDSRLVRIFESTIIIEIISAATFGRLQIFIPGSTLDLILNAGISSILYLIVGSLVLSPFLLSSKVNNIFRNKFQKTEVYSKHKEMFDEKEKELKKLKSEKKIVEENRYQAYDAVRNINNLIEDKEAEIEEFKQKVFALFFEEPKEENITIADSNVFEQAQPLVKKRKKD